jgi:NADH dehydrogenase/NADH:ubiquinone oxidoreductase subunit G
MIKVYQKLRSKNSCQWDTIIEWPETMDDPQLRCNLMNACPTGPFTYHGKTSFSFSGQLWDDDKKKFTEKVNEIYKRYESNSKVSN